jgi:DNA-binding MarR family transcriptional regulator
VRLKKNDSVGLVYLLKRAELAVRSCAEVTLASFRLTPAQFLVLFRLLRSQGVSSADLARTIGVRPQSIVDLIAPLEREGLIERREAPEHRRILRINLTPAGEKLLAEALPAARQLEKQLLSNLSGAQVAHLREGLTQLLASAQAHETRAVVRRPVAAKTKREPSARRTSTPARPRSRSPAR